MWLLEDRAEPEGHTDVLEPAERRQESVTRGEGWAEGVRVSDGHRDYEGGGILQSSSTSSRPALRPGWGHRGEPVRCPAEEVRVPGHRGQRVWAREEAAGGQGRSGWRKLGTGKGSESLAAVPGGGQRHCHWNSLRVGRHQGRCGLADQSHQKRLVLGLQPLRWPHGRAGRLVFVHHLECRLSEFLCVCTVPQSWATADLLPVCRYACSEYLT